MQSIWPISACLWRVRVVHSSYTIYLNDTVDRMVGGEGARIGWWEGRVLG